MVEEIYKRNRQKKWRKCLRCGKPFYTTLVHRFCRRCTKRNYEVTPTQRYSLLQNTDYRTDEFAIE